MTVGVFQWPETHSDPLGECDRSEISPLLYLGAFFFLQSEARWTLARLSALGSTFCTGMKMCAQRQPRFSPADSCCICISTPIFCAVVERAELLAGCWPDRRQPRRAGRRAGISTFYLRTQHLRSTSSRCTGVCPSKSPWAHASTLVLAYVLLLLSSSLLLLVLSSKGGSTARCK